jgi:hypothetical protein
VCNNADCNDPTITEVVNETAGESFDFNPGVIGLSTFFLLFAIIHQFNS